MRKLIKDCFTVLVMTIVLLSVVKPAMAIYDPLSVPNNKFGIHILEPNEIDKARELVNSSGGEWGYVTIPIRANDRGLEKWTNFMIKCRENKIIPILRIASFPQDDHWMAPNEYDLLDFANFLNQLPWPINNRYVIIYNEPNQENEWGGYVYPEEYARVLDRAADLFHQLDGRFFVISAGMDSSQPNVYSYYRTMDQTVPGIFKKMDGLSFHAYGNPAFTSPPNVYSRVNVASFRFDENYLCQLFEACNKPIFLTEAGWKNPQDWYFENAFTYAWSDSNIVAVTPFLLNGSDGVFKDFGFVDTGNNFKGFARKVIEIKKPAGKPLPDDSLKLPPEKPIAGNTNREEGSYEPNIFTKFFEFLGRLFK